jgi:hypothetical protein
MSSNPPLSDTPLSQTIEDEAVAAAIALALEAEPHLLMAPPPTEGPSPWALAGRLAQLNRAPHKSWR